MIARPPFDRFEVYAYKRKKVIGFKFRFVKAGDPDPMLTSDRVYDSADEALRVAVVVNEDCYQGHYKHHEPEEEAA